MLTDSHHQYIDRHSGTVQSERFFGDRNVALLYSGARERLPYLFKLLTSSRMSSLLGFWFFDKKPGCLSGMALLRKFGVNPGECCEAAEFFTSHRRVFERRIRYWRCRPMSTSPAAIVSPADARLLIGQMSASSLLFIKEKFFSLDELLGKTSSYYPRLENGSFAIFRLTPEKYHYNHTPVSGRVISIYEIDGAYHCCNPTATIAIASILSKNRRCVTIIDTDVPGGSRVGLVAMIEIVALMIGDIQQCYSEERYDSPQPLTVGMTCRKGVPKSLFRPGSSTVVLLFEPDRMRFSGDLAANRLRQDVSSRFSDRFKQPLVETDVLVRSTIGHRNLINHIEMNYD